MSYSFALNLEGVPKELKVLLAFLSEDQRQVGSELIEDLKNDIDWDLFLQLAIHHRLFPLLYSRIQDVEGVPVAVVQYLDRQYKRNTFGMLQLAGEMEYVSRLFAERQIRLLVLKGPVLATDLYGDVSLRTCGDLDVLVPIEDLDRVDQLLTEQGYVKDDYIETILGDWKWRHHHVTYFHSNKPIKLEIHWRLNPGPSIDPGFEALWSRKRISALTSYPVYYLGREDLFLFLISHGARHGWSRLRWLMDIHQLLKQGIDWKELNGLLKKYHYEHIAGQAILLAYHLLGSRVSEESEVLIRGNRPKRLAQEAVFYLENMVNLHTDPVPEHVAHYHKRHLFSLMSTQQKLLFLASTLHPYPEDANVLPLPKGVHFLYFPLRPIIWAWKKTKRHELPRRV